MNFFRHLLIGFLFPFVTTAAFSAAPIPSAPSAAPSSAKNGAENTTPTAMPSAAACQVKLDDYIKDLVTQLKLSEAEKAEIESYYTADGGQLQKILNDDTLSPLQQATQVATLRDARNAKIEALLNDQNRQLEFRKIEVRYRVALTNLAADGGLVAASPTATPATPSPTNPTSSPTATAPAVGT